MADHPESRPSLAPALAPVSPAPPPLARWAAGALAASAALAFGGGLVAGRLMTPTTVVAPPIGADACALPAGLDVADLAPADRAYVVRRAMLCSDVSHGRITVEDYRAALAALDAPAPVPAPSLLAPMPAMLWGSTVRDLSSQYGTTSWAAQRALGAPDVFPAGGDQVNAWASLGADDRIEHLEIGLDRPARLSAVEVFETYNPGAVSQIELITERGTRQVVYRGKAGAIAQEAFKRRVDFACTDEPIVAIRLTIDSPAVPDWNEIDAVGGEPCR